MNPLIQAYWFNPQIGLLRQIEAMIINRAMLAIPEGLSIDVGCGSGRFALALERRIDEGMDADRQRLLQAERLGVYGNVRYGRIEDLGNLHPDRYALIVANSVLEHVRAPDVCLRSLCKALRPGGILLLTMPTIRSQSFNQLTYLPENRQDAFVLRFNQFFQHRHLLDTNAWKIHCVSAGLQVNEIARYLLPETQRILDAFNPYQIKANALLDLDPVETDACANLLGSIWESWFAPLLDREEREFGRNDNGSHLFLSCTRL